MGASSVNGKDQKVNGHAVEGHASKVNGHAVNGHAAAQSLGEMAEGEGGKLIVITAPLTEAIDHAGYFIQMAMASLPIWMEWVLDKKYPTWRKVEHNKDGSALYMPAGVRLLEKALERDFDSDDVVACYPDDLDKFVGPRTRVVAVSTHNPLGVTFAAGVYTSIFGSSKMPVNSFYARKMFEQIKSNPHRGSFKVIVGGSGGWQIKKTDTYEELSVDCVVEGRSESEETLALFHKAIAGQELPREIDVSHPKVRDEIMVPDKRTTFGVVEMTTGCGRRCNFCVPDLNPQIDVPKDAILKMVEANVQNGNKQISLATEDMFIWGQVKTGTPFFFPNREALIDLFTEVVETPGVEQHALSHSTIAPAVVDPVLIKRLSDILLDKSPITIPRVSSHPEGRALVSLIGLETGSVRMAKKLMPGKAVPFKIDYWPSVVLEGLRVLNENNWFPMFTLMVGNPGETDEDVKATLDLVYEMERRDLFAFLVPSIFTPLHDTRMEQERGVTHTQNLSPLQWQLIMKCWKNNLRPGQYSWWGPMAWRLGALGMWAYKLRRSNGRNFTWPLFMFASALPEKMMEKMGKIYVGKPLETLNRKELLSTLRKNYWKYLRPDTGDMPDGWAPEAPFPGSEGSGEQPTAQ
ncbi:MAG TPA: radical SAM protein [Acidobacteriota bacterium]|nr:radical SAM protein [Acidobacteriota bacterium]